MSTPTLGVLRNPLTHCVRFSIITQPNMYARGILFGKMKYELGDHSYVRCPELDLVADVEFKTKGWVSGTYNAIGGTIRRESTGEILYELSGLWSEEMYLRDVKVGYTYKAHTGSELTEETDWAQRDVLQRFARKG